jgi:hypothetical protein
VEPSIVAQTDHGVEDSFAPECPQLRYANCDVLLQRRPTLDIWDGWWLDAAEALVLADLSAEEQADASR